MVLLLLLLFLLLLVVGNVSIALVFFVLLFFQQFEMDVSSHCIFEPAESIHWICSDACGSLEKSQTAFLTGFSLGDGQKSSTSVDALVKLSQVVPQFSSFSLKSEAWIAVFDMQSALLLSGILLIPKQPVFGNAEVKFVVGIASAAGKFPSFSGCLWSLISSLEDGVAFD